MRYLLTAAQFSEWDKWTIEHSEKSGLDLMESASNAFINQLVKCIPELLDANSNLPVFIFCGPGNNGGDGYAIARLLHQKNRSVEVFQVGHTIPKTEDAKINFERCKALPIPIHIISDRESLPKIVDQQLLIDAIFGIGLTKPIEGFMAEIIEILNASPAYTIAVDMPSGLFADQKDILKEQKILRADITITFQEFKRVFFNPDFYNWYGECYRVEIGLDQRALEEIKSNTVLIDLHLAKSLYRKRPKFSHKGDYGKLLIVAGSRGKMGAAVLCTQASLVAGAGLVTAFVPKCGEVILQTSVPEAMVQLSDETDEISGFPKSPNQFDCIAFGPGVGTEKSVAQSLKLCIQEFNGPLVIDADGLNILAENKTWLAFLKSNTILTPHPKEFDRLFGPCSSWEERIAIQQHQSRKLSIFIVLKGAYTSIACPNGNFYFNISGNPALAKGGSGDVLTGLIAGMLGSYSVEEAIIRAVFFHGYAADQYIANADIESLTASRLLSIFTV